MTPPLRVLHVHSGNLFGGVESMLLAVTKLQAAGPMENSFALCFEERFSRELRDTGAPVHLIGSVRVSRPWTAWRARRRLTLLLRQQRPDVVLVHSGWSHTIFGPTIQRAAVPLGRWFHAIPDPRNRLDRWSRYTLPRLAICNSEYTAQGVREQEADLAQVIVRPAVMEPPTAAAAGRGQLRTELGVPDGACVILQVGRMEAGKGHRVLLEALARLKHRQDWVAWQVGGAQRDEELAYLGALGLLAAKLGIASRVRFLGDRRDIREIFAAADLYCQPNQAPESFGITFIEALYAGLPVVTSGIGGANEIVEPSCGVLLPPGDATPLAEALQTLIADPAARRASRTAGPARARLLCDPVARTQEMHQALATRLAPRYG